ncbi:TIGR04283 family arsenosugar biosynthesis glycosyltransferase [Sedimentitalea todarodis]|uniref:TIGR04283 family arsenosugar biosynthesis glycosyltransferase n=1 Tax=Sedimentitalea todarodis TaxID=1631240 RepID=A0ABU3VDB8_9RHOB|nr:TIGR04283 family arsenosugar biosynthesis glycosyltransferase [Sedimentitalea todarodis]MDU9004030.1 TIGR04283 family arsenosugar biosynthesis glycosyltransferase [Sedimentitalea todarodis]
MPAEISIIIPTLNAQEHLPACLAALMEGLSAGLIRELIVSDGGSTDATCRIADAAGAVIVSGPASRGGQLRRGIEQARGRWLLVLHADTQLEPGWAAAVGEHLQNGQGASAHFRLAFRARGLMPAWFAGWANLRSYLFGLPYGDQGLLVQRAAYDRAGGYPDQPLMEDVALIRALSGPLVALPTRAFTSAERYDRSGWLRRGATNLWTLIRYFSGADPKALATAYRR